MPAPKGIKKKIGGRKPSPPAEIHVPDTLDSAKTSEARPKGIKRTIGGAKPHVDPPESTYPLSPVRHTPAARKPSPMPDRKRTAPAIDEPVAYVEMTAEEEAAEAERVADEKRMALKQEMESKPAPKKKKKF
jgi:hypothetical protein